MPRDDDEEDALGELSGSKLGDHRPPPSFGILEGRGTSLGSAGDPREEKPPLMRTGGFLSRGERSLSAGEEEERGDRLAKIGLGEVAKEEVPEDEEGGPARGEDVEAREDLGKEC